jgi:hypothetical protein
MITGELKSQIDKVWEAFWTGGLSNPLTVIEQMTYLLFIRRLDELHTAKEQKANLDLANEISRVTRVKYQQGVGSNLEVLNAESSIKESQANYFTALYNALVAKVELEKANGTLYID